MEKGGDPAVPDVDKKIIKENILIKPVRPYIYGIYSSLTENAKIIGEFELMPHADWTTTSPMPQRYLHFGGDESIRAFQKAQGSSQMRKLLLLAVITTRRI